MIIPILHVCMNTSHYVKVACAFERSSKPLCNSLLSCKATRGHCSFLHSSGLLCLSLSFSVFLCPLKKWWNGYQNVKQTAHWPCLLRQMTMIARYCKSKHVPIISFQNIPKPLRARRAGRPPPLTLTIPGKCLEGYHNLRLSETRWLAPTTRFTTTRLD